jgi:large subunit ribosomal protein L9
VAALKRDAKEKADAGQLAGLLEKTTLTFARKSGESGTLFGSVTSLDIAEALAKKGYHIDRRKVVLEDPLKQLGEFQVPVRLHKEVTLSLTVQIVAEEA